MLRKPEKQCFYVLVDMMKSGTKKMVSKWFQKNVTSVYNIFLKQTKSLLFMKFNIMFNQNECNITCFHVSRIVQILFVMSICLTYFF
jgi:hypothetical protein